MGTVNSSCFGDGSVSMHIIFSTVIRRFSNKSPFSLRDAYREKVRPGTGREAGLGHVSGRAKHGAFAEKVGMRGYLYRQLSSADPLSPALPLRGRE
jgi:hypothetical protein